MVAAQSVGHPACKAKWAPQSQGCRGSKACRHPAPNVARRHRVQLVIKEGRRATRIIASSSSRLPAGDDVPAGTVAVVRSLLALRCSKRANRASHIDPPASSCAIMRRARPYRGENPEPGKDVHGELDLRPGIRERPRPLADMLMRGHCQKTSAVQSVATRAVS